MMIPKSSKQCSPGSWLKISVNLLSFGFQNHTFKVFVNGLYSVLLDNYFLQENEVLCWIEFASHCSCMW